MPVRVTRLVALVAVLFALTALPGPGALRLPAVIGPHMVLQQSSPSVWGWATRGRTITVALAGVRASAVAGDDGRWSVDLPDLAPGGPHEMRITGDGSETVADVLVGDVWLAAGQSNMQIPVGATLSASEPIAREDCERVRLFVVDRIDAAAPLDDARGSWRRCAPGDVQDLAAVPLFFGLDLARARQLPIGLVVSTWGGTSIAVWLPGEASRLRGVDPSSATGHAFDLQIEELRLLPVDEAAAPLRIDLASEGAGLGGRWDAGARDGSRATYRPPGRVPGDAGRGAAFSGSLRDADAWAAVTTALLPTGGPMDLRPFRAVAWRARGHGVFQLALEQPSIVDADPHAAEAFRVDAQWRSFEAPLDALRQGGWGTARPFTQDAVRSLGFRTSMPTPTTRGSVFNAMIHPLTPLRLRGVAWYQGESDSETDRGDYGRELRQLILGWRAAFEQPLPFLIVQLPGFGPPAMETAESGWADVREGQRSVLDLEQTALVTTIDVGDALDVHPRNKRPIGSRLARAARHLVHREPVVGSGPLPDAATLDEGGALEITFAAAGAGLVAADERPLSGFSLSADGLTFHRARAEIVGPRTVAVRSEAVPVPVEVRYAWASNPVCNLGSAEGLPASPFRMRVGAAAAAPPTATAATPEPLEAVRPRPRSAHPKPDRSE